MKCPRCGGLGRTKATELVGVDEGLREVVILCPTCGGKGEVELTEQEYIQTCNTEQLAEVINKIIEQCFLCGANENNSKKCIFGTCSRVTEWLKQPHHREK